MSRASAPQRTLSRGDRALRDRVAALLARAEVTLDGDQPWDLQVHDPRFFARALAQGSLGLGESYMDGDWDAPALDALLARLLRARLNHQVVGWADRWAAVRARLINAQTRRRAVTVGERHYDLGNDLYAAMLGKRLVYSCGYWRSARTLDAAQEAKLDLVCRKLQLTPGQRVLDIGCGWGGMALYLHHKTGAEVLGITLSEEQLKVARARAAEAGVADKVRFELIDYRAVTGRFDRIVSVGMFEHVGPANYRSFFRQCHQLLSDEGVMLLHTIGRAGPPGVTDKWTVKYIFPGGYNPALSEIVGASEGFRMFLTDVEVLRLHYAHTLQHWYDRTTAARAAITELYDERFFRMWQFYLAGALCAFRYGGLVNYQLQYARNRHTLPITRDYMGVAAAALKAAP